MYDVVNMPDLIWRYFSSNLWLGAFIISTIYLVFRINLARKRAVVAATCSFFLIINAFVMRIFTALGENATFYRHLWAIPSAAIIGIAIVDLIRILPKWFLKIPAIAAFAVFLWFANQEYIRCRDQIFSQDAKMVQEDVISVAEELEKLRVETKKNTLYVVSPFGYSRPYGDMPTELNLFAGFLIVSNSSILNDLEHNGEAELLLENPDVSYIMSVCCSKGMDYVIISNNKKSKMAFEKEGYDPAASTDTYLIYSCSGYKGYKQDLNNWGQVSWITWYDHNGEKDMNQDGYCTISYAYDKRGCMISEKLMDESGNLVVSSNGYAEIRREYNQFHKETIKSYYNNIGELVTAGEGYAIERRTYDDKGKLLEDRFYNEYGEPCVRKNYGYSIIRYKYNENGKRISISYFDENNEYLINYASGLGTPHSIQTFQYDDKGDQIGMKYLNEKGEPSLTIFGYDEIRYECDEKHRIIRVTYYANGEITEYDSKGYTECIISYDDNNKIVRQEYYDINGNQITDELPPEK